MTLSILSGFLRFAIVATVVPMLVAAQEQPVPPAQPVPPVQPKQPLAPLQEWPSSPKLFEIDRLMDLQKELAFDLQHQVAFDLQHRLDFDLRFDRKFDMLEHQFAQLDAEQFKVDAEHFKLDAEQLKMQTEALQTVLQDFPKVEVAFDALGHGPLNERPRAPWASEDPADSLYRVARESLIRGEYRRAAQVFNELTRKFPTSRYAQDAAYWEAFARYRLGTTEELRLALNILEGKGTPPLALENLQRNGRGRSESQIDVPGLRARVQAALAARGDARAAEALKQASQERQGCDREEISVRAEALSALGQMDPAAAKPAIRRVLQRRDECTVELRRRALYLVGRQADGDAPAIILDVVKNDPDANMRGEAMRWLARVAGDNAIPQLEELLRTTTDEPMQRSIVRTLSSIDSERSRRAVRAIIERPDASERVRAEAILSLAREKEGRVNGEDMAYLRGMYSKLETGRLKEAVLSAISRAGTPDSEQFLLGIARNVNESPALRAAALQRLGRMNTVSVADIARLYDSADARSLREQILSALSQRKEPEAIDKMMEIARKDTDPQIRRYAISLLSRSNNERAKQLFKELIEQ